MPRRPVGEPKTIAANARLGETEKAIMDARMREMGISSVGEYFRRLIRRDGQRAGKMAALEGAGRFEAPRRFLSTEQGTVWHGNSLGHLRRAQPASVDLIVTSPPFGLIRKKSYGNEDAHLYCDWFRPFAEGFRRVLKDPGSLVIDLGGAWKKGMPTRSLYHFELLLMLCNEYGFHLCQEHYWWNPSKLPTPAEWVNIRRVRVKDAVNCIWWLSPTPWPKASNRRILAPYSESMRDLLANGYDAKTRPSGHRISKKFGKDNGGAVPPNLLAIANTESNGAYLEYCRSRGIDPHPARFPALLPEYFIRMLTDPGDRVLDPFAGSCVTGMVAEALDRRWDCVELNSAFLDGAKARFQTAGKADQTAMPSAYVIQTPCAVEADDSPLPPDGGRTDPLASTAS
jgi:DNA modification methylase